ncbi:hypothetical protein [Actinomadura atramentaria]|uniref:hypothetical protein n=1 Tax=Actinomadura atramentaria TaxID=1990 RepID=UPI000475B662|nr:hypothetical protein [Actinomadura atramentaria]
MRSFTGNTLQQLGYPPPKDGFRLVVIPNGALGARNHTIHAIADRRMADDEVTIRPGDGSDAVTITLDTIEADRKTGSAEHVFKRAGEWDVIGEAATSKRTAAAPVWIDPMKVAVETVPNNVVDRSDKYRRTASLRVTGVPYPAKVTFTVLGTSPAKAVTVDTELDNAQVPNAGTALNFDEAWAKDVQTPAIVRITCDKFPGDSIFERVAIPQTDIPVIASISVAGASGLNHLDLKGGQPGIMEGTGLTGVTEIRFGKVAATDLKVQSDTLVTFTTPAMTVEGYQDLVIVAGGQEYRRYRFFSAGDPTNRPIPEPPKPAPKAALTLTPNGLKVDASVTITDAEAGDVTKVVLDFAGTPVTATGSGLGPWTGSHSFTDGGKKTVVATATVAGKAVTDTKTVDLAPSPPTPSVKLTLNNDKLKVTASAIVSNAQAGDVTKVEVDFDGTKKDATGTGLGPWTVDNDYADAGTKNVTVTATVAGKPFTDTKTIDVTDA